MKCSYDAGPGEMGPAFKFFDMKLGKTIFAGMYAALAVLCPDAAAQDTTL